MTTENKPKSVNPDVKLKAEELIANLSGFMVDRFRRWKVPYANMNESEQKEAINDTNRMAELLIEETIKVIADKGIHSIVAKMDKTGSDGKFVKGTVSVSAVNEEAIDLLGSAGKVVRLVLVDKEQFEGGEKPKAEPDQQELVEAKSGASEQM